MSLGVRSIYKLLRGWSRVFLPHSLRRSVLLTIRRHARYRSTPPVYGQWLYTYETRDILEAEAYTTGLANRPTFTLVVVLDCADSGSAKRTLASIRSQKYPPVDVHCLVPASTSVAGPLVAGQLTSLNVHIHQAAESDDRAMALNAALAKAGGAFVIQLDTGDELAPHALYALAKRLNACPDADLLYSDEDMLDSSGRRVMPFFKPDWSPDLLLSFNYLGRLVAVRTALVQSLGGFREGFPGFEDFDLCLRVTERTERIEHIPQLLCHRRVSSADGRGLPSLAARQALVDHVRRQGVEAEIVPSNGGHRWRVRYAIPDEPEVAVILPTGGNLHLLSQCLRGLKAKTDYQALHVVLVDNSRARAVHDAFPALTAPFHRASYIDKRQEPFNYSRLNNEAIRAVDAPVVLLLNDDIVPINDDWLRSMLEHALRPQVGAVGAQLLYPDNTFQHAGVVMGVYENSSHAFKHLPANESKSVYFGLPHVVRNCSAVTAACLMMRRDVFWEVGGFDEIHLSVAFQDVDLCLKARERGYLIVCTPYARLIHYESKTKVEKMPNAYEVRYIRQKWARVIAHDPYYNPNLTRLAEDFSPTPVD